MHQISDEDCFLILASDGVWEFMDMHAAVEIVDGFYKDGKGAIDACRLLLAKSALLWRVHEGQYRDDITAVVVYLPPLLEALRRREGGHAADTGTVGA